MISIKVYGVRCYARRLGASGCNAHAKAQAALGPGLRRTSHAIVQPLRPPFLSFSLPPTVIEHRERFGGGPDFVQCKMKRAGKSQSLH